MKKLLAMFFISFVVLGLFYPVIGILALICMLTPPLLALFLGRFWCGNFCPRGAFLDVFLKNFSQHQAPPQFLKQKSFRIIFFVVLMSFFGWQLFYASHTWEMLGWIFVKVILGTSALAIILGLYFTARTWCLFCPMGTLSNLLTPDKAHNLFVGSNCIECQLCTKSCPLQLKPYLNKGDFFSDSDCLKCGNCIAACPKQALKFVK